MNYLHLLLYFVIFEVICNAMKAYNWQQGLLQKVWCTVHDYETEIIFYAFF